MGARVSFAAHRHLLANRLSERRLSSDPPVLTDAQKSVLTDLKEHGIAITSFRELLDDQELWEDLSSDVSEFVRETEQRHAQLPTGDTPGKKDEFIIMRSEERAREAKRQGVRLPPLAGEPWMRFGLSEPVLDTINVYRQMWTKLVSTDQWYTVPYGRAERRVGSQDWHRDPEDLHVIKVFVYFSDVDQEAGPFEYVRGSAEGGPYGHLWPWSLDGIYPPRAELAKKIPDTATISATGPTGTIIFCDSSGFHRGGFAKTRPRVLSVNTYVSPAAYLARGRKRRFSAESPPTGTARAASRFALN